jgi:hypothetical protein
VSVYLEVKLACDFVVYLFGDMAVHFGNLLALSAPVQDPINPLSCRSITAAAAAPTLTHALQPALHCALLRGGGAVRSMGSGSALLPLLARSTA